MASKSLQGIRLVVLDNGATIPQTVDKRLKESVSQKLLNRNQKFILSALMEMSLVPQQKNHIEGRDCLLSKKCRKESRGYLENNHCFWKRICTLVPGKAPVTESLSTLFLVRCIRLT